MYLLIFGPPGAGKGTQAQYISSTFHIPHISTGDIFRENIKKNTPMGIEAKRYSESGHLVPDTVTNAMIRDRLKEDDCVNGFLLDGYPRTLTQANELESILDEMQMRLDAVISLKVSDDEIIQRLAKRGRTDDTPETLSRRLKIYHETTKPVEQFYRERGKLVEVNGIGNIQEITSTIIDKIHGAAPHASQ